MQGPGILQQKFSTKLSSVYRTKSSQTGQLKMVKYFNNSYIKECELQDSLSFNTQVFQYCKQFIFPSQFLQLQQIGQTADQSLTCFITNNYQKNLDQHIKKTKFNNQQILDILNQIVKTIYSLYMDGYWTRSIRPQHFIYSDKSWKIICLVFNQRYLQANGNQSQYLWNPRYQAPQFFKGQSNYSQQAFQKNVIWNIGCIILQCYLIQHRLVSLQSCQKFKGKSFTFSGYGIGQSISSKVPSQLQQLLSRMLHYDPQQRMSYQQLFKNQYASSQVAKHYKANKNIYKSKNALGISSSSSIKSSMISKNNLNQIQNDLKKKQQQIKIRKSSKQSSSDIVEEDEFFISLNQNSKVKPKQPLKKQPQQQNIFAKKPNQYVDMPVINQQPSDISISSMIPKKGSKLREIIQLYKSYFDQAQLLYQSADVIQKLQIPQFEGNRLQYVRLLIRYSLYFLSAMTLHKLADGINQNKNILSVNAQLFIIFIQSKQYQGFKQLINDKRKKRQKQLADLKKEIKSVKIQKIGEDDLIKQFLLANHREVLLKDIKNPYRYIVKLAYDAISQQYNKLKKSQTSKSLAKIAMYVTYCLTTDKLYIKNDIPQNFKYYFEWTNEQRSTYIPMKKFKQYIENAPRDVLIQHSRFILQKYFNI